jgi:uncharacterized protein with HEPN domain
MNISPDDLLRLRHMRDFAREVIQFTRGAQQADLQTNRMLLRAVCMDIGTIGEAASQVSQEFRDQHPEIPWRDIIATRNFLYHVYWMIRDDILWQTAIANVPDLLAALEAILPPEGETNASTD